MASLAMFSHNWAWAQSTAVGEAVESQALEEVVVTAEKRATNLQSTALAMSAISGDELRSRQVTDVQALSQTVPGVDFADLQGQARISIRGVTWDNLHTGDESPVAYYVDGIYVARPAAVMPTFFDVDRVEVVRGPQGTLYGRNATGGVVNVITGDPTDTPHGFLNLTAGNYAAVTAEGAVSGPLASGVSGRIAFQTVNHDGYGVDTTNQLPVEDQHTQAMRGKLRFKLADNFDVLVSADYMHEKDHADAYHYLGPGKAGVVPLGVARGGVIDSDPRDLASDGGPLNDRTFWGAMADAHLKLGSVDIRSITGYRHSFYQTTSDTDMTSTPISTFIQYEDSRQYSQELRFSGGLAGGDWLLGAYYFNESLYGINASNLTASLLSPTGATSPLLVGSDPGGRLTTKAYAAFGQYRYPFTERLAATVGGRYSDEQKGVNDFSFSDFVDPATGQVVFPPFPPNATANRQVASTTFTSFTPKAGLEYQANGRTFLYASYSQGFKSGGYNLGAIAPPFKPARVTQYELGGKIDWLRDVLRTNVAVFYSKYDNMQVNILIPVDGLPRGFLENAANSHIKGAELEVVAVPTRHLRLDLSYAYLDARYVTFSSIDAANTQLGLQNLSGHRLIQAPPYTVNLAATYTVPTRVGDFSLRGEGRWEGRVYFTPFQDPIESRPPHQIYNAYLDYVDTSGAWTSSLFVRNVANKTIITYAYIGASLLGYPLSGAVDPPRTFGASLAYHF
jgi:iron complex outermembrane receptor protein